MLKKARYATFKKEIIIELQNERYNDLKTFRNNWKLK